MSDETTQVNEQTTPAPEPQPMNKNGNATKPGPVVDQVQVVNLEDIIPNPNQPRRYFDEASIEGLAANIREMAKLNPGTSGLLQPVIITTKGEDGKHVIIAGERRFRAIQSIKGRKTIESIVRDVTPEQMYAMSATENLTRQDMTPIEEARVYAYYEKGDEATGRKPMNHGEIAKLFGKSRPVVANMIGMLDLPQEVQDELAKPEESRRLGFGHARALKGIKDHPEILMTLFNRIISEGLSAKWAEEQVTEAKKQLAKGESANAVQQNAQTADTSVNRTPGGAAAGQAPAGAPVGGVQNPTGTATTGETSNTPAEPAGYKLPEALENAQKELRKKFGNDVKIRPGTNSGEYTMQIGPLFGPLDIHRIMKMVGCSEEAAQAVKNLAM